MPESLTDMMAAGDPMLTPASQDQGAPIGPPPPMNTTPEQQPPANHQQMQQMMMQQPLLPQTAVTGSPPKKKTKTELPDDVKDAFVVSMVAFLVLVPNVQSLIASKLSIMENPTAATLVNAVLIAVAFYFLKEHVVGML